MANGALLNFEGTPSYVLTVQVTDAGGMTSTGPVTINLANANEAPTAVALSSSSVTEGIDTAGGYAVGTLSTTDVDVADIFTYSVVGGTDAAKFSIAGAQLRISDGVLDFETKPSYQVTVRSTDSGGLFVDRSFTVTVDERQRGAERQRRPQPDHRGGQQHRDDRLHHRGSGDRGRIVDRDGGIQRHVAHTQRRPGAGRIRREPNHHRHPAADAYGGPVTVTLSVSDGVNTTLRSFLVTIDPIADHVVVVTTASDLADGDTSSIDALLMDRGADGFISLREAIVAANNSPNAEHRTRFASTSPEPACTRSTCCPRCRRSPTRWSWTRPLSRASPARR